LYILRFIVAYFGGNKKSILQTTGLPLDAMRPVEAYSDCPKPSKTTENGYSAVPTAGSSIGKCPLMLCLRDKQVSSQRVLRMLWPVHDKNETERVVAHNGIVMFAMMQGHFGQLTLKFLQ
jgi:hypothetical protein